MRGNQCDAQFAGGKQHDRVAGTCCGGQVFGMAAERDVGIVDNCLVYRSGDQRGKAAIQAAGHCGIQCVEYILSVAAVQYAALYRGA